MRSVDERRYLWILRSQGFFLFLAAVALVILVFAYQRIQPGVKYEAFLVEGVENVDAVVVRRAPRSLSQGQIGNIIAKNMIINYVESRESLWPDRDIAREIFGRSGSLGPMTSSEQWEAFTATPEFTARANPTGELRIKAGVMADKIRFMPKSEAFEVPLSIVAENIKTGERTEFAKTVEIKVEFAPASEERSGPSKWRNPTGFRVVSYKYL